MVAVLRPEQVETIASVAERLESKGLAEESHALRSLVAELESEPQEISPSSAAQILYVTPQTVRNWVRAGVLPGRQDQNGRFYIPVKALTHAIEMRAAFALAPDVVISDDEIDAEIEAYRAERRAQATAQQ